MTKSWKDYPTSFLSIVDRFEGDKSPLVVELPQVGQLRARRRLFYLFFKAIGNAVNAGDREALRAYHITRNLTIGVSPARGPYEAPGKMTITYDPFAAALELEPVQLQAPNQPSKPETKSETSHERTKDTTSQGFPGGAYREPGSAGRDSDIISPSAIQEALRRKRQRTSDS